MRHGSFSRLPKNQKLHISDFHDASRGDETPLTPTACFSLTSGYGRPEFPRRAWHSVPTSFPWPVFPAKKGRFCYIMPFIFDRRLQTITVESPKVGYSSQVCLRRLSTVGQRSHSTRMQEAQNLPLLSQGCHDDFSEWELPSGTQIWQWKIHDL